MTLERLEPNFSLKRDRQAISDKSTKKQLSKSPTFGKKPSKIQKLQNTEQAAASKKENHPPIIEQSCSRSLFSNSKICEKSCKMTKAPTVKEKELYQQEAYTKTFIYRRFKFKHQ